MYDCFHPGLKCFSALLIWVETERILVVAACGRPWLAFVRPIGSRLPPGPEI